MYVLSKIVYPHLSAAYIYPDQIHLTNWHWLYTCISLNLIPIRRLIVEKV